MVVLQKEGPFELLIMSIVSFSSACFSCLLLYCLVKFHENKGNLLIVLLALLGTIDLLMSIAAGIYRLTFLLTDPIESIDSDPKADVYKVLAFFWGWGQRLSILIPFFFTVCIYLKVSFYHSYNDYLKTYLGIIFLISLVWASVPLCFDAYGINEDAALTILSPLLVFLSFYLPLVVILAITLFLIFKTLHIINSGGEKAVPLVKHQSEKSRQIRYVCFPIVLIICYFLAILRRILNIFELDDLYLRFFMNFLIGIQSSMNLFYYLYMNEVLCAEPHQIEDLSSASEEEDHSHPNEHSQGLMEMNQVCHDEDP